MDGVWIGWAVTVAMYVTAAWGATYLIRDTVRERRERA
jgi:hypothetical protein